MNWIKVTERLPREDETVGGRVPVLDRDGYLGYGVLIDNKRQEPWIMSEFDVEYWLPVPQPNN